MPWEAAHQHWAKAEPMRLAYYVNPDVLRWFEGAINYDDLLGTPQGKAQIVEAIYTSLRKRTLPINYAPEKFDYREKFQPIRHPEEVLGDRSPMGTCLDLSLIFCGLCLAHNLLPILIILDGHALVVVALDKSLPEWNGNRQGRNLFERETIWETGLLTAQQPEQLTQFKQLVEDGVFLAVECTGFAHSARLGREVPPVPEGIGRQEDGTLTFERAKQAGREQLERESDRLFQFAMDIAIAQAYTGQPYSLDEGTLRLRALLFDHSAFLRDRLSSFVGRTTELVEIKQRIQDHMPTGGYVTITGQAGQGKSSIIAKLVDDRGPENVAYHFIPFNPGPDHQVGMMHNLMARLILKYDLSDLYVASDSRPALRDYFPHVLLDVRAKGGREVIFLDGLDQLEEDATGVRDLTFLPTNPPPGIVFVLGTRPNDTLKPLELLKAHDEYQLPNLSREDFDRILQHRHVSLTPELVDRFYHAVQENALYLDLVAQELAKSMGVRPEEIIERVAANPDNIFSLSMLRLKRQKVEWRDVVKPILGILLVVREPCSFPHIRQILQLDADRLREGIERLGGLISNDGSGRYALFHLKFYDYLRQDEMNPEKDYIFARDEEETWHQTLANWCEKGNIQLIWEDAHSNRVEQERRVYARKYFIAHLYFAHQDWQRVFAVLDAHSFGQMKVRYDPSTRSYSDDLDLGRKAAAWENWTFEKGVSLLPHLWRYTLLRCSLASRADRYPASDFRVLMLLGREQEALGLAELLTDRAMKAHILITMAKTQEQQHRGAGSRKQEEIVIDLWTRAYEVVCTIEGSWYRANALRELGAAYAQVQKREQAKAVWAEAERVSSTIEDSDHRAYALRELGAAYAQAQEWAEAQRVSSMIEDSWYRANALRELGAAYAQAQEWAEAERVIGTIEDSDHRANALRELGAAYAQAQEREQAKAVWAEAQRVSGTIEDSNHRANALRELGAAYAQAREWAEAERVIGTIEDSNHRANALRELGAAYAQAREWAEAERVIGTIEDSFWRTEALRELGAAYAQAREWAEAERVSGTIEDSFWRANALRKLGAAYAQAREWAEAERVIGTIEDSDHRANALCELGAAYAQAQEREQAKAVWAEAQRVIGTIKDNRSRAYALRELGAALAQVQEREQAKALWAEAQRVSGTIKDSDDRAYALRELGAALAQAQEREQAKAVWAEAQRVIGTIKDSWSRVNALRELGAALAQAQEREQAKAVWAEAERVIGTIKDSDNRVNALCELGAAYAQAQEREQAKAVWAEAERVIGTIEDSDNRVNALRELGAAYAQAREWAEAERVSGTIEDSFWRAYALRELGAALAQAQEWAEAERVIGTIEDSDHRAYALRELGAALMNANEHQQLLHLVQRSWQQADTQDSAFALLSLANGLIPLKPEIGNVLFESFSWVDDFLKG